MYVVFILLAELGNDIFNVILQLEDAYLLFSSCGNLFLSALLLKGSVVISGRLGSTSSSGSCGSADYIGEVIPHHPGIKTCLCLSMSETVSSPAAPTLILLFTGLPRQDSGHWWTSFFFAKQNQPGMQNGSEHQKWVFAIYEQNHTDVKRRH